ncbi:MULTISPECIES: hypothetical protein [unclassified Microcoleus]|uniref:hypothetical protein n=1 Tax=unclassified Microcoleus TaxID=2642155 RepID=UPI002FD352DA
MLQVEAIALSMNRKKAIANSFQIAIAFLSLSEKGRSLFFYRRWTQINADVIRAIALLINYGRSPF